MATRPGRVTFRFVSQDRVPHNLHVVGKDIDAKTEVQTGPITQTLDLYLEAGTYTYFCDIHPELMKGELTVT